jgi:ribonuclease HI
MKTLKFEHELADQIRQRIKTSTWRIYDDKNIKVNDEVEAIDKVDSKQPDTWVSFGTLKIDRIEEKRLEDIEEKDMDGHEKFDSREDMLEVYRKYYGPEVGPGTPIKVIQFTYSPASLRDTKKVVVPTTKLVEAKLYADGGSRGNPGPSATGFAITDVDGNIVVKKGTYLGVTTNNQAEYRALLYVLEEARRLGVREANVFMDSMLVVNQMKGIFKVRNRDLWPVHDSIKELLPNFSKVTFTHIPREMNKIADKEVNDVLDAVDGR